MTRLGRSAAIAGALVGVMVLMWILAAPPQVGPDEPDHRVRAAALARGMLDPDPPPHDWATAGFELPAWIDKPAPNCYKFLPLEPVSCSTSVELPTGEEMLGTRAEGYQIWGHLLPGVGTLAPRSVSSTAARLLDAAIPVAVLGLVFAAAARRGWLQLGAAVFAVTPMAWFMFAVVNPSGLVIAGGILTWSALVSAGRAPPRLAAWMFAVGWALLVLPRRDGMIWAALSLSIALLTFDWDLRQWWRRLGLGPQIVVLASTAATLAWAATSDTNASRALLVAPLVPVGAEAVRRLWQMAWMRSSARRAAAIGAAVVIGAVGAFVVMDTRGDGFDRGALRNAILRSGEDIQEAIGHLGWLDTPLPTTLIYLWLIALGVLAAMALVADDRRVLGGATAVLLAGITTSWVLTMLQNQPLSTYWQGRYYLPLLVGIPMLLGTARLEPAVSRRVGRVVLACGLLVANVALAAAIRRWADGVAGTLLPWEWDTYDTILPPMVLLAGHLAASFGLWRWAVDAVLPAGEARAEDMATTGGVATP